MSRIKAGSLVLVACKDGSALNNGKTGAVVARVGECIGCGMTVWEVAAAHGKFVFPFFGVLLKMSVAAFHDKDLIPIDPDESTEGEGSSRPVDREVTA